MLRSVWASACWFLWIIVFLEWDGRVHWLFLQLMLVWTLRQWGQWRTCLCQKDRAEDPFTSQTSLRVSAKPLSAQSIRTAPDASRTTRNGSAHTHICWWAPGCAIRQLRLSATICASLQSKCWTVKLRWQRTCCSQLCVHVYTKQLCVSDLLWFPHHKELVSVFSLSVSGVTVKYVFTPAQYGL